MIGHAGENLSKDEKSQSVRRLSEYLRDGILPKKHARKSCPILLGLEGA